MGSPLSSTFLRFARAARPAVVFCTVALGSSCSSDPPAAEAPKPPLLPGEHCDPDNRPELRLTFDPPTIVVAPGRTRPVRLVVEPDQCLPSEATFTSSNEGVAAAPTAAKFDLRHATYDFVVTGGAAGKASVRAKMKALDPNGKEYEVDAELPVDVRDAAAPTCAAGPGATGQLSAAAPKLAGSGALASAEISAVPAAFTRTDALVVPSFPGEIACGGDMIGELPDAKLVALGPAVTFAGTAPASMTKSFRHELDFAVPVNPAAFPAAARLRHLVVLYKGPRIKKAKPIPIASPRIEAAGDGYVLRFSSPWLGTYQAAVEESAGTHVRKRKLTHRAVIGFSMGGGGAATFGVRHHDKFDVIGPLGGPSDWTWMLWYVENYVMGGFCPANKPDCQKYAPGAYPLDEAFAHTMDYDHWWYEKGDGNGGRFPRDEYVQIFEDLSLAQGNPNGQNADPLLSYMAAGPKKTDPWVVGDSTGLPPGVDCSFTVDPIDGPDKASQQEIDKRCKAARCDPKNTWKAPTGYYNHEYNPDGSLPVISFCDGAQEGESPYLNTWKSGGQKPMNLALAVDLNGNGVRDPGEPILRSGHEPYEDCGADGLCNPDEPGYDPVTNPDPNQDDYDYQLNPDGTEGNHRWDAGEKFLDYGLDGVPNTATKHVAGDVGEGDGKFTEAEGLANFYKIDPHSLVTGRSNAFARAPLTDDALMNFDVLSDGGVRDLFNFATVANHLTGAFLTRKRAGGLPLRSAAYYNGFHTLPGQDITRKDIFLANDLRWADIAAFPNVRYGDVDATPAQILQGDGQHVGTAAQLLYRLQTAFFYVGSRWPDADRLQTELTETDPATGTINELGLECERAGRCEKFFTGPRTGRTGPIAVSLPPGYALESSRIRDVRYPVLYVLHGYGQDPRELEGVAIFTNNFMNLAERSYATRLPKFILVYVDGRCRVRDGKPECIRGTFFQDSARPGGALLDAWFDEVVDYVDQNYRTMGPSEVEVTD